MRVPGLRRASARLRLAIGYSALFLVSGAALLALSYVLVSHIEHRKGTAVAIACRVVGSTETAVTSGTLPQNCVKSVSASPSGAVGYASGGLQLKAPAQGVPNNAPTNKQAEFAQLQQAVNDTQSHTLHTLLIESGVALGLLALASLGFGWWIAGRVLRPVHRITDTARQLSEQTLHDRIHLDGPQDELKELADTFDAMLGRLDRAFNSQRRFVANASHELRTPLATERILIDEALANRGASTEDLRAILEQLRLNSEDTERLIDALLVLARSERGIEHRAPVDLAAVTGSVVARAQAEAVTAGVELRADLGPASALGDHGLLERLTGNLIENAIRHNHAGGWVTAATSTDGGMGAGPGERGWAMLEVTNSGRVLDPDAVAGLIEPFRREGPDRTRAGSATYGGFGLGLSIVDAIVSAHGGRLQLTARPDGGLLVRARLPAAPGEPAAAGKRPQAAPVS